MQAEESTEQVLKTIEEKTSQPRSQILELLEKKKQKYSGMLTDSGAAWLVAKDLGVELRLERKISEKASISSLQAGLQNIDLEVKVVQAFQAREFEKNSRKGKILNLIVGDESGEIRLTLWHKDARSFEEEKIEKGSRLALHNCRVQEFQGKKQLSLDYNGSLEVLEKGKEKTTKLEELREGMQNIDVIARIARVFPAKKFLKEAREGRLANFELSDATASVRATAWNDLVQEVESLRPNDLVKIENAYAKQGLKEVELHLGWQARIIKEPKTSAEIPELPARKLERKAFAELAENQAFEQKAVVLELLPGRLFFEVCPKCGKKPQLLEGKMVCENCGQVEKAEKRIVVSAMLDDASKVLRASFFGKQAEELLEESTEKILEKIEGQGAEKTLKELNEKVSGKEIEIQAIAKKNQFSGELEVSVRRVDKT